MKRLFTTIGVAVASVTLGAQAIRQAGPPQRDVPPPTGSSAVAGVVLTDERTPQPVRRAAVMLSATDGSLSTATMTDDAGRFTFSKLPARRYSLSANKPGYVRTAYGAKRPGGPGTQVSVADGEKLTTLEFRLPRGAVVTGRIVDEHGQPAQRVNVRIMQFRTVLGERTLAPVTAAGLMSEMTDDLGVYRLYGLPAGDYVIAATPPLGLGGEIRAMSEGEVRAAIQAAQQPAATGVPGAGAAGQQPGAGSTPPIERREYVTVGYAPVYYPGTTMPGGASIVTVGQGEERGGIDFQLQLVRTARIEGTVIVPAGITPQSVQLSLTPAGDQAMAGALPMTMLSRATPDAEGKFAFTAVGPGQYTLSARATQRPPGAAGLEERATFVRMVSGSGELPVVSVGGPNLPTFWANADVAVNGTKLSNVTLSLQPGMTISGKIQFAGKNLAPPTDLARARVSLSPIQTSAGPIINLGGGSAQVEATGLFTLHGVVPGRYRLEGTVPMEVGTGWRLQSVVVNGRDVFDFPLEIAPGASVTDAVLTFTDVDQQVSGTLQDATGRPAPDYTVVVFPSDKNLWRSPMVRRIRIARPGTDGRFTVANLPAGDYRIAALTDIAPGEHTDPSFLEQIYAASVQFSLAAGEKKVQDFRISGR
jgi:hypothetical protein